MDVIVAVFTRRIQQLEVAAAITGKDINVSVLLRLNLETKAFVVVENGGFANTTEAIVTRTIGNHDLRGQ